ncbi:MAG TPA: TonB-dependent receptor, partial [Sulfurimonas autotrophica]|nr:TonB-dependent receptor [Sulfurimonas autotrophica]
MVAGYMNKFIILGALPLIAYCETLETIIVEEHLDSKENSIEESFFRSYQKEIISREDILENSAVDVKDALKHLPNVTVKDTGSFTKKLSIRGLSGDRVISVVDGVKLVNQGITHSGGGELGLIEASTIEKIELVKGSPSVIYDPGATGGVINISTIKDISKIKDKIAGKYTYQRDEGYKLNKHTLFTEAKYQNFYSSINYSTVDSKDRNVKDKNKIKKVLLRTNFKEERYGSKYEITDLGYKSDSYNFFTGYKVSDNIDFYLRKSNYLAEDISFTHGASTSMVIHYDEYERDALSLGAKLKNIYNLEKIDITVSEQKIRKMIQTNDLNINDQIVDTKTIKIDLAKRYDVFYFLAGSEFSKDKAETYTFSNQDYFATYLNGEYNNEKFILNAGLRYNHYKVKQEIEPGRDLDTIYDLVGISGVLKDDIIDDAFTYGLGATYLVNDNHNIAFNYSKTYRYPTLYERFAFDSFVGGGADMMAEEGDNLELSWKYLDDSTFVSLSYFYTDFSTYNNTYEHRKIKDLDFLKQCLKDKECNPYDDDHNEDTIFSTFFKYASFYGVKNSGFELSVKKEFKEQAIESGFDISLSALSN